jgi:hypothetical protein
MLLVKDARQPLWPGGMVRKGRGRGLGGKNKVEKFGRNQRLKHSHPLGESGKFCPLQVITGLIGPYLPGLR